MKEEEELSHSFGDNAVHSRYVGISETFVALSSL